MARSSLSLTSKDGQGFFYVALSTHILQFLPHAAQFALLGRV
jgi:hypothetical protein